MSDENQNEAEAPQSGESAGNGAAGRAIGIAALAVISAAVTFVVVRKVLAKAQPSPDPTAARIQALMDEANRLLKELDAKKLG
jgi:hypothetical protein